MYNTGVELRDYQISSINEIRDAFALFTRVLYTAPTGSGKTTIFADIVERAYALGNRCYILCHRAELIEQISYRLSEFGTPHGIIAPGRELTNHPIQVCSIQSLNKTRRDKLPVPDLLIVDEAHHAVAASWQKVLAHWQDVSILGVTATPERLDGKGLSSVFEVLVNGPDVGTLIERGFLSTYRLYAPSPKFSMAGVRRGSFGDYSADKLAALINRKEITGDVIKHYLSHAAGTTAVVFCVTVAHAEEVAAQFRENGIEAISIDGSLTPTERRNRIDGTRTGKIKVLTSCELISEGFDCPSLETCIVMRPTASLALHLQMLGRVLRPLEGKRNAVILDMVGNVYEHGLPCERREWDINDGCTNKSSDREALAALRMCQQCFAVFKPSQRCPQCGTIQTKKQEIKRRDGKLTEVEIEVMKLNKQRELAERKREIRNARTLEELQAIGIARGYKDGWAEIQWFLRESGVTKTYPTKVS